MALDKLVTLKTQQEINRKRLQKLVFLVILPVTNLLFVSAVLFDIGKFNIQTVGNIAIRVWVIFGLAFLVFQSLEEYLPRVIRKDCFICQLALHILIIVGIGSFFAPVSAPPDSLPPMLPLVVPRFFIITLEITLYLIVLRTLDEQTNAFSTMLVLRESELNVLRSQSNPHFLFNTLNLINSEISDDPDNAKEIVYDLADLLRKYLKMAQQSFTTVSEELKLVNLYLTLQQKRFKNRLTFDIEVAHETHRLQIPALLLQPVVENTIKYAVEPYAAKAHVKVETNLTDKNLVVVFKDTGPVFDDKAIEEGDGFRILRKTLDLHFANNYELSLKSTETGGEFKVCIPVRTLESNRE